MATLGKPSISTPRGDQRALDVAISNIRQRIEQIEAEIAQATAVANSTSSTNTNLNTLRSQLQALTTRVTAIEAELAGLGPRGFAVWTGSTLTTRTLQAGGNIEITNPTGFAGDPVISAVGGGGDVTLYDNQGRAAIVAEGGALILASGA